MALVLIPQAMAYAQLAGLDTIRLTSIWAPGLVVLLGASMYSARPWPDLSPGVATFFLGRVRPFLIS